MQKKQEAELIKICYWIWGGEYPVVVFDLSDTEVHMVHVSKVLTSFVSKHNLLIEKTVWLISHSSAKNGADRITEYECYSTYNHNGKIGFTNSVYNIPQVLFQALIKRCEKMEQPVFDFIEISVGPRFSLAEFL